MFYLHIANRTEDLLEHLGTVLQSEQHSCLTEELFVVQSQGMERVICQGLAKKLGVFANYRFFFPLEFLNFIAEKLNINANLSGFDRETMAWRLETLLRDIDDPVYQPLAAYLQGENAAMKRFQLARRLADCFDQYQLMRREMVLDWQKGEKTTKSPAEQWQMALWQRLLAQGKDGEGNFHRTMLFDRSITMLRQAEKKQFAPKLPHRISVFGVHTLPPVFLDYLDAFAEHSDVHFYLLSPCKEYWGDVESRRTKIRKQLKDRTLSSEEDFRGHPLLGSLGRQGRDLQRVMTEMNIFMEFSSYTDPWDTAKDAGRQPTMLEGVQHDLLYGEISSKLSLDSSVRIVSCHSRVRELEVLREHLLELLDDNHDLLLRDIIVMAPDIQQYAPFIPAIFHDIEHSVADRSLQAQNPAIAAFSFFLSLFSGKFGRSAVLELLQHQGVAERFAINRCDIEKIIRWSEDAGICWGLSAEQRQSMGRKPFAAGSFRAGLDRLLMGYATNCDDFVADILPFSDIEGKQAQALGGLCQLVEFLEQTAVAFKQPRSLSNWRQLLLSCVEQLLLSEDSTGEIELRKLLYSLGESECFTGEQEIEFSVIEKWFTTKVDGSPSSSGFLRGQMTFCSMLPMRSIPFQVVCLLGLNDGEFPKSDRRYSFDLLSESCKIGDRSPKDDDRYQFLEAILAARQTLYLSYIGQSEKSGEKEPPSVVVSELLDLLNREYDLEMEAVEHPLYPFGSGYFDDSSSNLFSYSEENFAIAGIRQKSGAPQPTTTSEIFPWWQGNIPFNRESVSAAELIAFYKDPPGWFVRNIVGISPAIDEGAQEDLELFALSPLIKYGVKKTLFSIMLDGRAGGEEGRQQFFQHSLRSFQQNGEWPLGAPGESLFNEHFTVAEKLALQAKKLDLGRKITPLLLDIAPCKETAQLGITGKIDGRYERGNLIVYHTELKGYHLIAAWIYHLLDNFQQQEVRPTWLLTESRCGCFSQQPKGNEPLLLSLLQLWEKGCTSPLPLYTEAAFEWAGQKDKTAALKGAIKEVKNKLKYKPEWSLLLGGKEIEESVENMEFQRYAEEIITPIYTLFNTRLGGR